MARRVRESDFRDFEDDEDKVRGHNTQYTSKKEERQCRDGSVLTLDCRTDVIVVVVVVVIVLCSCRSRTSVVWWLACAPRHSPTTNNR